MNRGPHYDYDLSVWIDDEVQYGKAEFRYASYPEPYVIRVGKQMWLRNEDDRKEYGLSDSNGSGPESFPSWERARRAFLETVAQQVMLDAERKMEVTR